MSKMKTMILTGAAAVFLAAGAVGAAAAPQGNQGPRDSRVAACDKFHRCVTRDGRYLEVNVRTRATREDDYGHSPNYVFVVNDIERPTLRYGNNGFTGQAGYWGNGGFRTQLGNSSFDNLR